MLIEHNGVDPTIDPAAWVAPTAVVSGDVTIGPDSRVLHGAVLTAESGPVSIGRECIIMEQAVIRASKRHPVAVGDRVLVGPHAYLSGCAVADEAFLAAGTRVFNGARIGAGAEVRINAVVHLLTVIDPGAVVPISWVAVGDPAQLLSPDQHDEIWAVQKELDFPGVVFGMPRKEYDGSLLATAAPRYARALHATDTTASSTMTHVNRILLEQGSQAAVGGAKGRCRHGSRGRGMNPARPPDAARWAIACRLGVSVRRVSDQGVGFDGVQGGGEVAVVFSTAGRPNAFMLAGLG